MKKLLVEVFLWSTLSLFIAACTSQPKRTVQISVPQNLDKEDVELGILLATGLEIPKNREFSSWKDLKDSSFKGAALQRVSGVDDDHDEDKWVYETLTPNVVFASYADGKEVLRVKIQYSRTNISISVDGSNNMNETATSIHRSGNEWMEDLRLRINRALGKVQLLKKNLQNGR